MFVDLGLCVSVFGWVFGRLPLCEVVCCLCCLFVRLWPQAYRVVCVCSLPAGGVQAATLFFVICIWLTIMGGCVYLRWYTGKDPRERKKGNALL